MKNFRVNRLVFILSFVLLGAFLIDMVIAVDGFIAYRSNTGTYLLNSSKLRYWDNTANGGNGGWGGEIELSDTGSPIRYIVLKQSSVNSKRVIVTQSDDGNLDGYVCMHDCNGPDNWTYSSNIGNVGIGAQRRFDLTFEAATGDLLLVYSVVSANGAQDLAFKVLPENTETLTGLAVQYINDNGHAGNIQYYWVALDSDPVLTSEEILLVAFDFTDTDINAWVWSGSAWANQVQISGTATATNNREALAVKYAADGTKGMVVGGDGGAGNINSQYWNGAWNALAAFDEDAGDAGADVSWLSLKADPSTDDLQLVIQNNLGSADLGTSYWNGAAWTMNANIDAAVDAAASRTADFSWLAAGGTGQLVWDTDAALTTISYRTCTPQCNVAGGTVGNYAGTGAWNTIWRNPTSTENVKLLGFRLNSNLDIGSFWFNGAAGGYTNYGDSTATADTTVTTYEAYYFDFRRDVRLPAVTFITPNVSGILQSNYSIFFNITTNEYLLSATLEWNGSTNYSMNISLDDNNLSIFTNWYYILSGLNEGFYTYMIYAKDLAGNINVTDKWNITINFPPNITIVNPQNNTLNNYSRNTTFYFNVTDNMDNVSFCSLIVDGTAVLNTTVSPLNETATQNFTYALSRGQHNWSIWCNDTNNLNSTSEVYNITSFIEPVLYSIYIDDDLSPLNEIILSAGSTRFVNCSVVVGDPEGPDFINNVTAKFYYYLNKSSDPDDNNVHYTNSNCTVVNTTNTNKTFLCGFNILYYANNGTWICNLSVNNPYSNIFNISTSIRPLYAVNLTDGIDFANVTASVPSNNITVNITNFGNMPINVTLQGYALVIGDNTGMNCSDNTNITIQNIRFAANTTADFAQKIQLNGSIQPLNFQIKKQTTAVQVFNTTYWQISADPGTANRICTGYVIFNAEAS